MNIVSWLSKLEISSDYVPVTTHFRDKKIIVYGAGTGLDTLREFIYSKYQIKIDLVVDIKFKKTCIHKGLPSTGPESFDFLNESLNQNHLIVFSIGSSKLCDEIKASLILKGFKNFIHAQDIYEYHLSHTPIEIINKGPSYFLQHSSEIQFIHNLLQDKLSREVFKRTLEFYITRHKIIIPSLSLTEQYFPHDVPFTKSYERFINCGSYDGDTIRNLVSKKGKIQALACFEPDPDNFKKLEKYIKENEDFISDEILLFNGAIHEKNGELRFSSSFSVNSSVDPKGTISIKSFSIDELLENFCPTFINMDIEGSEFPALKGAKNTILKNTPDLAICVYHTPDQLWTIPSYLYNINPNYKFFLRNHTGYPAETVLYVTS